MPKDRYFISTADYIEPFGQTIPKGSILKYMSVRDDSDYFDVLYFDKKENCVYPIIFIKSKLNPMDVYDIDISIKKKFDERKRKPKKTFVEMYPDEKAVQSYLEKLMEIRKIMIEKRMKNLPDYESKMKMIEIQEKLLKEKSKSSK